MTLNLNKLESPSPKDSLCQVSLKLAQWTAGQMDGLHTTDDQKSSGAFSFQLSAFSSGELKKIMKYMYVYKKGQI